MTEYRRFSEAQIIAASEVDLVQYLQDQGEKLIKSGREFRWGRYSSVTIKGNKWFKHKSGEGGNAIHFLREFYDYNFKDAVNLLLSYRESTGHVIDTEAIERVEPKEFVLPKRNETMWRLYGYLLKTRYIDKEVIDAFVKEGLIYEDSKYHNVVFVGVNEKGEAKHAHKKSTYTSADGRSYRGNVEGSDSRFSFHYLGESNTLYIFEAPIDMLSYISLHKDNWQQHSYVSMCGIGMQPIEHFVEEFSSIDTFVIGTDNDSAGHEGREKIQDYIVDNKLGNVSTIGTEYKDFNERLMHLHGKEAKLGEHHPNYTLLEDTINNLKIALDEKEWNIEHRDLTSSFASMYYALNKEGKNNLHELKKEFIVITNNALGLAHKYSDTIHAFDKYSSSYYELQDNYRAYKDKGNLKKRIERIKQAFSGVKQVLEQQLSGKVLGEAYQKVANECVTMIMDCERKLQQEITLEQKPKIPLLDENSNIFNILGVATKVLQADGMKDKAEEMFNRIITQAKSNEEALQLIMEYVEPIEQQVQVAADTPMQLHSY